MKEHSISLLLLFFSYAMVTATLRLLFLVLVFVSFFFPLVICLWVVNSEKYRESKNKIIKRLTKDRKKSRGGSGSGHIKRRNILEKQYTKYKDCEASVLKRGLIKLALAVEQMFTKIFYFLDMKGNYRVTILFFFFLFAFLFSAHQKAQEQYISS